MKNLNVLNTKMRLKLATIFLIQIQDILLKRKSREIIHKTINIIKYV